MDEEDLAAILGKVTQKGGCLHIKKLADVNLETLQQPCARTAKAKKA